MVSENAANYRRELSDVELVQLGLDVDRRVLALASQGLAIPADQITSHLVIGLLEQIIGPEESLRVREWHLTWLDRQLDRAEGELRAAMIGNLDVLNGAVQP